MARTKQEVRDFLNSQVGQRVNAKAGALNGQCVTLVKALLEFLGAPEPYKGRGDARYVGDNYVSQGIANSGTGWLVVCVNPNMGGGRGHCWIDVSGEANYEQNGAKALQVTKNTRPISQARQFVNLDKYVQADRKSNDTIAQEVVAGHWGNGEDRKNRLRNAGYDPNAIQAIVNGKVGASTRKSNDTIAREVVRGEWGNGEDRKRRLAAAGYDHNAIRAIVNRLV